MIIEGWGVQMYRLHAWKHAANLAKVGIRHSGATLSAWRGQMGSSARTWAQVHEEARQLIAVETMCRLMETAFTACSAGATES